MAGAAVAVLDVAVLATISPVVVSYGPGAAFAVAELAGLFALFSLPLAGGLALLDRPAILRRIPSASAIVAAAILAAGAIAVTALISARLPEGDLEFNGEVRAVKLLLVGATMFAGALLVEPLRAAIRVIADRAPLAAKLGPVVAFGLCALSLVLMSHLLMAPIYQLNGAAVLLIAAGACAMLAVRAAAPYFSRRTGIGAMVAVALPAMLSLYLPGPARDHSRWVVFVADSGGSVLAARLRSVLDRDGDGSVSPWFGGTDCAEGNPAVGPGVIEIPADGIDQDCRGGDAAASPVVGAADQLPADCHIPAQRMSVLLIVIDSLRADALSAERTPELLELAGASQSFAQAYSPTSTTETTFPSLLSSRPLSDTGARNPVVEGTFRIDATMAERFEAAGYATAVFSDLDFHPICMRGFQARNPFWRDDSVPNVKHDLTTASYARGVLDYMKATSGPKFVLMHLADVHAPYVIDEDRSGRSESEAGAYLNGVEYTSKHLGQFFARLQAEKLLNNTVIALTADHGEELLKRGHHGHGASVFDEATHVPLILWIPGCPAHRYERAIGTTRLGPTLGTIAGVSIPGLGLFSESNLPVVTEGANEATMHFQRGIVLGRYKLIVDVPNGGRMLFDLQRDPGELTNILPADPSSGVELENAYQRWLDTPGQR